MSYSDIVSPPTDGGWDDTTTPLSTVLQRLHAKRESRHLDLRVDGLSDAVGHDVIVRYAARVPFETLRGYMAKRKKQGGQAWEILGNLDLLVDSCIGVYAVIDGKSYGMAADAPTDPADWPRFDERLHQVLPDGVGESAVSIARGLFEAGYDTQDRGMADPEIMRHGDRVLKFYGYGKDDDDLGG